MARRQSKMDFVKREVVIPDVGTFPLSGVAASAIPNLTLLGLKSALMTAQDVEATYAGLVNGVLTAGLRKSPTQKIDPWREAMALAMAEQMAIKDLGPSAKKAALATAAAGYLAEMREHLTARPKEARRAMKTHPLVIQHYNQLTGVTPDQLSLLAIAGVLPEAAGLPLPEPEPEELAAD